MSGKAVDKKEAIDIAPAQSQIHREVAEMGHVDQSLVAREPYGPGGFKGLFSNHYVAMCAAFATIGGLLFGYDQGVISVTLVMDQFLGTFPRVSTQASGAGFWKGLMTAMLELGALIGALFAGWLADKLSRKYSIVVAVVVFTVGSVLQTAAVEYAMLTVGRLIGGMGIGALATIAPLYISEIAPPEIRGALLVLQEFSIVLGIVIAFWTTYGTRFMAGQWSWRLPFLIQMIPGFILGAGIVFLPFSPRWLSSKGRNDEALNVLAKLRSLPATDPRVLQEWCEIRAEVVFAQEVNRERHPDLQEPTRANRFKLEVASWMDCFRHGCWKRTVVGVGIMFFQQFVGINALIYYAPSLFETLGQDYEMRLLLSGIINCMQLVGVATSLWTMDRFGRRPLLLTGAGLMFVCHLIIAVLVGKYGGRWEDYATEGWVAVAFLFFYMFSFGATWGPVPWAMPSEIFPSSLRAKGVALSTCSNWFNNFIIGLITPPLVQNTGFGAYTFFAVFCALAFLFTFFCVPETAGKSLEQMDEVFKDVSSEAEEQRKARIMRDIVEGKGDECIDTP
ncbi:MFS sugar transporter-like protein [Dothidotthia symphoricarpi CBS 119687]|uniref:MFS sugar transporter-like protein n=1 Tax=Dothidotthia symphoricarpi CBS 119687 TaxID=1392245 RepID=A0A6A6AF52_9PLEO|nr:MFS sugar transporter-like protein [Dothidotthia symphoricarpi CBS 119687]KAF2129923.1 MFS sugar transporter-like protein [Dothidotthia symphoricarpi CBS 119687]